MISHIRGFRAGDLVEVRSEQEILSTLDGDGKLDGLPFMPEMLQYCGKQVRVFRRANKTCDTTNPPSSRRMTDAVLLEGLRCDGTRHGGCQASCLLFWKDAWLRPLAQGQAKRSDVQGSPERLDRAKLEAAVTRPDAASPPETVFVCQATELPRATTPLVWWDPRQYLRELWCGNIGLVAFVRALAIAGFNIVQRRRGGMGYPRLYGTTQPLPPQRLDLRPGERVRVRSLPEIRDTINMNQKSRGLWFDVEMVPYCGREFQVQKRVSRIINERTGKMIDITSDCIVLDGVICHGNLSRNRLFCPRSITAYWRESWLERVGGAPAGAGSPSGPGSGAGQER